MQRVIAENEQRASDPAVHGKEGRCDSRDMTDPTTADPDHESSSPEPGQGDVIDQINTPPAQTADTDAAQDEAVNDVGGTQVSQAGGASLNEETNAGGADAVPDTHG